MDRFRQFLFALAYLALAAAGAAAFFGTTALDQYVGPNVVTGWRIFFILGGLFCAVGVYTHVAFELVGLPLLGSAATLYAVALLMLAVETDRGWMTALIMVGVTINFARRWISAWATRNDRVLHLRDV